MKDETPEVEIIDHEANISSDDGKEYQYYADVDDKGLPRGFYVDIIHAGKMPSGVIPITTDMWRSWSRNNRQRLVDGALVEIPVVKPPMQLFHEHVALGVRITNLEVTFPLSNFDVIRGYANDVKNNLGLPLEGDHAKIPDVTGALVELSAFQILALYKIERDLLYVLTVQSQATTPVWPEQVAVLPT